MKKVYKAEQLGHLFRDSRFVADTEVRYSDRSKAEGRASYLVQKYKIWSWLSPVVEHYLMTGEVNVELANDPVNLRKDHFAQPLSLVLAPDITQPVLREFITDNWAEVIKPNLNGIPKGRENRPLFPGRDDKVFEDYENRAKTGLTIDGIAMKYSISSRTVNRIVSDRKKSF